MAGSYKIIDLSHKHARDWIIKRNPAVVFDEKPTERVFFGSKSELQALRSDLTFDSKHKCKDNFKTDPLAKDFTEDFYDEPNTLSIDDEIKQTAFFGTEEQCDYFFKYWKSKGQRNLHEYQPGEMQQKAFLTALASSFGTQNKEHITIPYVDDKKNRCVISCEKDGNLITVIKKIDDPAEKEVFTLFSSDLSKKADKDFFCKEATTDSALKELKRVIDSQSLTKELGTLIQIPLFSQTEKKEEEQKSSSKMWKGDKQVKPFLVTENDINLANYPDVKSSLLTNANNNFIFPDMHGNIMKLIHFLIRKGILKLSKDNYDALYRIYTNLNSLEKQDQIKALNEFYTILSEAKYHDQANNVTLHLIGDILCDRGQNDGLTLLAFKAFDKKFKMSIAFSNHDREALKVYNNQFKDLNVIRLRKNEARSCPQLSILINRQIFTFDEESQQQPDLTSSLISPPLPTIKNLFENFYFPNLKIIDYVYNEENKEFYLIFHAPNGLETIEALAKQFNISSLPPELLSIQELCTLIDQINSCFAKRINDRLLVPLIDEKPIITATSRRKDDNQTFNVPQFTPDGVKIIYCYGHESLKPNIFPHMINIDNMVGREDCQQRFQHLNTQELSIQTAGKAAPHPSHELKKHSEEKENVFVFSSLAPQKTNNQSYHALYRELNLLKKSCTLDDTLQNSALEIIVAVDAELKRVADDQTLSLEGEVETIELLTDLVKYTRKSLENTNQNHANYFLSMQKLNEKKINRCSDKCLLAFKIFAGLLIVGSLIATCIATFGIAIPIVAVVGTSIAAKSSAIACTLVTAGIGKKANNYFNHKNKISEKLKFGVFYRHLDKKKSNDPLLPSPSSNTSK